MLGSTLASGMLTRPVHAAEPETGPVKLTPEEEAARLQRKMEALRKQDRRGKADAKVLFGADFQAGKREVSAKPQGGFSMPILTPFDVGGVNLQRDGGSSK